MFFNLITVFCTSNDLRKEVIHRRNKKNIYVKKKVNWGNYKN